ncbi:ATP-binding protein [Streptomyces sp. NPDC058964]|uniref:ATP-binding protein n=1 Tax=Streptomyces sp. NPDC058964 TaxID=3346681 RepID=UPI0036ACC5F6
MGTSALADEVLAATAPLRPLLDGAGTTPLPNVRDSITGALTQGSRTGEQLMLLARTKALPAGQVLTRTLPAGPQAAPMARQAARRQLKVWGVDDETAYTTELIVSELVGNAVRYGSPPMQLRLIHDRMLTCEVSDASASTPRVKHARIIDETGRGLFIIASLADQWGTRYQTQGKTVWAQQPACAPTTPHPPGPPRHEGVRSVSAARQRREVTGVLGRHDPGRAASGTSLRSRLSSSPIRW